MINQRHFERLRQLHRNAPSSFYADDEVIVAAGKASVIHPIADQDRDASRRVDPAVYYKLLSDAAMLAAGSLVEDRFVTTASFNYYVTQAVSEGQLHATAQVVHARGSMFTVNTVLTDVDGRVLAVGYGTYNPGPVAFDGEGKDDDEGMEEDEALQEESDDDAIEAYGTFIQTPFGYVSLN